MPYSGIMARVAVDTPLPRERQGTATALCVANTACMEGLPARQEGLSQSTWNCRAAIALCPCSSDAQGLPTTA